MVGVTTTIVVAIAAGAAAVALLLVVLWLVRGAGKGVQSDERLAELVSDMNSRMETMVSELSEALEHAQEEGRRNQMLAELAGTIDLDEVLTRTLDAAGAMPGVDAALARLDNGADTPIIATLGLTTEEAQRQAIAGPPGGAEARSISLVYQYPTELVSNDGSTGLIHSGLAVPIQTETGERKNFKGVLKGVVDDNVEIVCDGHTFALPLAEIEHAKLVPDWDAVMHGRSGAGGVGTANQPKPIKPGHRPSQKQKQKH